MEKEIINHIKKKNKTYLKRYEKRKPKMVTLNWHSIWGKLVSRTKSR
jgi:hypothetical protein